MVFQFSEFKYCLRGGPFIKFIVSFLYEENAVDTEETVISVVFAKFRTSHIIIEDMKGNDHSKESVKGAYSEKK